MVVAVAAVPIAMHAVLAWVVRVRHLGTGNDDAVYLLLARALREGHYRELFYVGNPLHSQYPPGYPALLALLGAPSDGSFDLVSAVNSLLSCTALALLFDVIRRWSVPLAVVAVAVLALNPSLVQASSRVQSEPLFMAAVMLALWALRPSAQARHRWIAIAAIIAAALTRSAGVALVAGMFVHFLLAREWKNGLILVLVSALTIVPWIGWTVLAPKKILGRSYIADALATLPRDARSEPAADTTQSSEIGTPSRAVVFARAFVRRFGENTPAYLTRTLPTILAIPTIEGTRLDNAAWLLAMLVALVAGVVAAMRRWRAAVLTLAAYAALLLIWPYVIGRFVTPLLPVLVGLMLLGAWRIGARLTPRIAIVPALALSAVMLVGGARSVSAMVRRAAECQTPAMNGGLPCDSEVRRYRAVTGSLAQTLPPNAHVFTTKEGTFYYLTSRQVVSAYPAMPMEPEEFADYLRQSETTLIFMPHLKIDEWVLGPALAANCAELTDTGTGDDELLLLFARPPGATESNACAAVERWRATW
jgi:MFS family permease